MVSGGEIQPLPNHSLKEREWWEQIPLPVSPFPLQSPASASYWSNSIAICRERSASQDTEQGREGCRVSLEEQVENIPSQLTWALHLTFRCPRERIEIGVAQAEQKELLGEKHHHPHFQDEQTKVARREDGCSS